MQDLVEVGTGVSSTRFGANGTRPPPPMVHVKHLSRP